ncbi:putative MFS transporter [Aspergillus sclerotioniger CBS 115572]|uniref:Putative MFS transporter n=1 Tax=Aspergillus sclerotioniger CBS 115572 TaxID=1450535 RepID=A0A317WGZ0_9EURO|nr:putative MFS transporter [Aspergillus sclerotioniger CBS 115572]PWY85734.1 putative MFS transporter [Aspergillus sclerotioniger CBS 115572]
MISATKRWFRRNRKGLAIGAGVIGAGYLAGQYLLSKILEARERMSSDRIARENLRRRFEQNQTDCTYTVLALLPTAAEDILEALPVEELTKELQKKRAERLARLNAGEGTGSDLSSVSPSITDDDRRSLSSFQSDGFVRTSQLGESTFEGGGPPRPKRNKTQLWNEVKITSITRSVTLIYTLSLLTIFTRIQLNLLGRRNYLSSVISMATPPADASTIRLEDHDDDDLTQTLGNDFETNRRYLAFSWWLLHRGWKQLMDEVQAAVTEVFGPLNPREDISLAKLSELTLQARRKIEGNTEEDRKYVAVAREEEHLLEESGVLGVTEPTTPQTTASLRHLLDETADLIDSPTFTRVMLLLNNECFQTMIDQCKADAFKSSSQGPVSVPQSFTSVATVVPVADISDPKTKLANVLAVLARQAHVIGNGTAPPNLYLTAIDQGDQIEALTSGLPPLTTTTERKLMAKIDWHIVPCLCVLYLLAFLDRVNISNAAVLGLQKDLDIVNGTKYNTALTIFFVPYVIFEIPSNILLKMLKPHVWLSMCMFMFGVVMICQGLVSNWGGLMTTRWFLGMFETGMFPGCFYLLGMWYKRSEAQKRFSFFFSSTTLAGAFGGLLASGLGKMDGIRGYGGWRWVFIIEGVITSVVAVIWFFVIPGFPEDVKWLNEEERTYIRAKLAQDVGKAGGDAHMGLRDVLSVFKDCEQDIYWRVYVFRPGCHSIWLCLFRSYYHQNLRLWSSFTAIQTQLYSIPPWAAAFAFSMIIAALSDQARHRFAFTLFPMMVAMAGYGILLNIHGQAHRHVQYGALFMVTCGSYSAMPVIVCWFAMNLGGHRRRSVGTAWQIGFGNIGGIISTYSFLAKDAPLYRNGYIISLSFLCFSAACCIAYFVAIWAENKRRDRAMTNGAPAELRGEEEEVLGDLAVTYRYAY